MDEKDSEVCELLRKPENVEKCRATVGSARDTKKIKFLQTPGHQKTPNPV